MRLSGTGRLRNRSTLLLIDQVVSGASNLLPLIIAGLVFSGAELSAFALTQAVILGALALQRAYVEGALASQRRLGQLRIPRGWAFSVAGPIGVISGVIATGTHSWAVDSFSVWWLVGLVVGCAAITAQDMLRYCLISERAWRNLLIADVVWLSISSPLVLVAATGAIQALIYWAAGAAVSVGVVALVAHQGQEATAQNLSLARHGAIFSVAKWILLDASIGQLVLLLPLVFARLFTAAPILGVYRLLQSSLAPINTIYSAMSLSLISGSHQFAQREGQSALARRLRRLSIAFSIGTLAYCIGVFAVLWLLVGNRLIAFDVYLTLAGILTVVAVVGSVIGPHIVGMRLSRRPGLSAIPRVVSLLAICALLLIGSSWHGDMRTLVVPLSALAGATASATAWFMITKRLKGGDAQLRDDSRP